VFGGSFVSWSATLAANTVTVQDSLDAKFASRSSVNVVGPPVVVAACPSEAAQVIENHPAETLTASENVTLMFESKATPLAPAIGLVAVTLGATSEMHERTGEAEFRGAGAVSAKSEALLSVSVQPSSARNAASVVLVVPAGPDPSKKFALP
jgi:hypothetical protein